MRRPSVAILGAGAGGLAMAIALKRAGYADFTVFEKADGVGGTWRDNTYPGAACDVPSHLYSYSFELNPNWSETFATQPEILAYLEHCTDKYGIRPHVRCNTAICEARWSDAEKQWQLRSAAGEEFRADVLVSALGMLNVPHLPEIAGRDRFAGSSFHSARWDHSVELAGTRVGVIGTGASALQFVPAIAPDVAELTVFQRSPTWIAPRIERAFTPAEQHTFARRPWSARILRWKIWWQYERGNSFGIDDPRTALGTAFNRSYLERKIDDPELRAALTPDYPVGCKRPLFSSTYYPTLRRDNVRLVTAPIAEITPTGIVTDDGEQHALDTIVFGTGFNAADYLSSVEIFGRAGRRLHDDWRDGAEAYLGLTVAGYPNLFLLYGPNTNGVNSIIFMHEAQAHYIVRALTFMRRARIRSLEVKASVERRYNAAIQQRLENTVWAANCSNYFRTAAGKIVTQLPYSGGRYWLRTRSFAWWRYRATR